MIHPSEPPAVTIVATRTAGIAPAGVHFRADLRGLNPLYTRIRWDFGAAEAYDFVSLDRFAGAPPGRARHASGWAVGHVFVTPGRHTVTVTASDWMGMSVTDRVEIVVEDPEIAFGDPFDARLRGRSTVAVSQAGDFTGAPEGCATTGDLGQALIAGAGRVLLRRGERFGIENGIDPKGVHLGAFGPPADPRPVLHSTTGSSIIVPYWRDETDGMSISGIDFLGDYDPAAPQMEERHLEAAAIRMVGQGMRNTTIFRCGCRGLAEFVTGIYPRGRGPDEGTVIADCTIADWYNFGIWGMGRNMALVGCAIRQNADTRRGPGGKAHNTGKTPNYADHGPVRLGYAQNGAVTDCDMRARGGWSNVAPDRFATQPCLRVATTPDLADQSCNVADNRFEGGFTMVTVSASSARAGTTQSAAGHFTVEGNTFIADATVKFVLGTGYDHFAAFSNTILVLDTPPDEANPTHQITLFLSHGGLRDDDTIEDVHFYANTTMVHRSADRGAFTEAHKLPEAALHNNTILLYGGFSEVVARSPVHRMPTPTGDPLAVPDLRWRP
jgi:hypothetical protein